MRAAVFSWRLRPATQFADFEDHLREAVALGTAAGADLLVLPENITFELRPMCNGPDEEFARFLASYSYSELLAELSRRYAMTIVGGTHYVRGDREIENHALVAEEGRVLGQPKCVLTQWEITELAISPGSGTRLYAGGRLGALVCYDVEFPRAARSLAEAGALALAVPAFTETAHGFHRVRSCAHARAIELQIFVLHASLVGGLGVEPAPRATGTSAILAPSVPPFPATGVMAETPWDEESLAVAELDFDALVLSRDSADVRNWHDRNRGDWTVAP